MVRFFFPNTRVGILFLFYFIYFWNFFNYGIFVVLFNFVKILSCFVCIIIYVTILRVIVNRKWKMDRRWMYLRNRLRKEYIDGVKSFVEVARLNLNEHREARCPCWDCKNSRIYKLDTIEQHLYRHGFVCNYKRWIFHGEEVEHTKENSSNNKHVVFDDDSFEDEARPVSNDVHGPVSPNKIF